MRPRAAAALAGPGFFSAPAAAEKVIFKCHFDWVCDPNRACADAGLDVRFRVNLETNAVERLGGDALTGAGLILGDRAITILETPVSGGAATTTVMITDGEAARSENLVEGVTLTPMQYLGECITI